MDIDQLKAELFGTLFVLANRLQVLGDQMDDQISTKQWLLLAVLFKEGGRECTLSRLAELTGSSRQNVKKMAQILQSKGFLTLRKPEEDKRSLLVSPAKACLEHLRTREAREEEFLRRFYQGFTTEELLVMRRGLLQWMQNLQDMERFYEKEN